ncbi:hypothetical protein M427DRAFT_45210 [Gonapodya prolifera JEL478]|uniref:TFIIB-type domain-containing protein n=1 Tax=Gonapodya prolifera (strain JEL478) TaxID=1344416 RepID=A0A139ABY4_GONPJ|nr:hypothetical protein M427DRAFT_45210 [Gonapodya prolifera JEL478]|eukprot:KXS14114.1 hypothetical protein M427DRAFT_45210 [Gonapodya prolifera JEL478]
MSDEIFDLLGRGGESVQSAFVGPIKWKSEVRQGTKRTLDTALEPFAHYTETLARFNELEKTVQALRPTIDALSETELTGILDGSQKNFIGSVRATPVTSFSAQTVSFGKYEIEDAMARIEKRVDLSRYLLDCSILLTEYLSQDLDVERGEIDHSLCPWLSASASANQDNNNNNNNPASQNVTDYLKPLINEAKETIRDRYFITVEGLHSQGVLGVGLTMSPLEQALLQAAAASHNKHVQNSGVKKTRASRAIASPVVESPMCSSCGSSSLRQDELSVVCSVCGLVLAQTTATQLSWQEMLDLVRRKAKLETYKPVTHFNEALMRLQAKGKMKVDQTVVTMLRTELEKDRITDTSEITPTLVRNYLHKLGFANYYDVIPYIVRDLTGRSPTQISPRTEEQMRGMFLQIQASYEQHRPGERSSFLNYSYVTYKIAEILNLNELRAHCKLLKSSEKLRLHDDIWKLICEDMVGPFTQPYKFFPVDIN